MLVIDASATMTWLMPDEADPVSKSMFLKTAAAEVDCMVPAIWRPEVASALLRAERLGRITPDHVAAAFELLDALPIELDLPSDAHRIGQIMRLARTHELTVSDASYLELVLRLNGQLFSFDRALVRAAKSCGITCIDTTPSS